MTERKPTIHKIVYIALNQEICGLILVRSAKLPTGLYVVSHVHTQVFVKYEKFGENEQMSSEKWVNKADGLHEQA